MQHWQQASGVHVVALAAISPGAVAQRGEQFVKSCSQPIQV